MAVTPTQQTALDIVNDARDLYLVAAKVKAHFETYWDAIASGLSGLAAGDTVPGTDFTKAELESAITLLDNFKAFYDGDAVATAAYHVTINITRLKEGAVEA